MCTVVILIRPGRAPFGRVMLAANRDERIDRPWDPPAEYWPGILGGRDRTAGGTWMALNRAGVVATVLNRPGTLGPAAGKRSRGELPLLALCHDTAAAAVEAVTLLDAGDWRGFNMVIADADGGYFVRGEGVGHPHADALLPGVSMVTAHDPNDLDSPRTARHLARFRTAEPELGDWSAWRAILMDRSGAAGEQINVVPRGGFGTVCSSLLSLPAGGEPEWLFADGPPHEAPFRPIRWA
ncbi:MAG TPA: NRDE family protein [Rhodopila sp.]|uniref:NRDE family protein n=1 Tax=Rhodopila sp. TaxID=2480087 RepID=UPI002BE6E633|nr:NRDE family protein [Rhodopila sp.]HVY16120.1 NRDE family protein [Rhodopila sp.]